MLEAMFGDLSDKTSKVINEADASQIIDWAVKALDAPSLDAIINENELDPSRTLQHYLNARK